MKTVHPLLALLLACMPLSAEGPQPAAFKALEAATELLDKTVAAGNRDALLAAFPDAKSTRFYEQAAIFEQLEREHERTGSFSKLYKGRAFPASNDTFKLGGHDSELGHVHIDFIRDGEVWKLKDIWICR